MEHEQWCIGQTEDRMIGNRTGPGDTRVNLTQVDLTIILIKQEINLKVAAISLLF